MMVHEEDEAGYGPVDRLQSWFDAREIEFDRISDEEIVATVKGAWGQYELRGIWREDDGVLQFLAFPDIRVPEHQRSQVHEAIGLINEGLWLGHFEIWSQGGAVLYRHALLLPGDALGADQAETLVEMAIDDLDRFYPVFQFVMWGGKSAKDALAAALVDTRGEA